MMPQAAAAGALYVSAENPTFNNTFGGAQIIEVVVIGVATETDEKQGEPVVKVDENQLRLAQAIDGNWYGYFGDKTAVRKADATDNNLDFGTTTAAGVVDNSTGPVFINGALDGHGGGVLNAAPTLLSNHTQTNALNGQIGLVVSGNEYMGAALTVALGGTNEWPLIQTYDFTIGDFEVIYEKAGADEVVVLDYNNDDLDDFASLTLDRSSASQDSEVHVTITDNQLNIDPTAEDVVMFYVAGSGSASEASYVSFTNGTSGFYTTSNYKAYNNDFGDNGKLIINNNTNSAANDVLNYTTTLDDVDADAYLVFWESSENSGVFTNTDDDDNANINVKSDAKRGTTATFDYNDAPQSFVVANFFGEIDMDETSVGSEWNSGETLIITLIDEDLNKNTASDEDLTLSKAGTSNNASNTRLIPSMIIGNPLVLGNDTMLESRTSIAGGNHNNTEVSSFSHIANVTQLVIGSNINGDGNPGISINSTTTVHTLRNAVGNATYAFINYDIRNLLDYGETPTAVTMADHDGIAAMSSTTLTDARGMVEITGMTAEGTINEDDTIVYNFTGYTADTEAIAVGDFFFVDIFTFGTPAGTLGTADVNDEGTIANNAIYRMELEETGDNTSEFVGEIEFIMVNQLNYDVQATYEGLVPISDEVVIFVHEDLTDADYPIINYLDVVEDEVSTYM
jgi:hypothetical protein